jgi:hypothetical protein
MKQYVGFSTDHSASMGNVAEAARKDYNQLVSDMKMSAIRFGIQTVVSRVACGVQVQGSGLDWYRNGNQTKNILEVDQQDITAVDSLNRYVTNGRNTPLFDSVAMLLDNFENVYDANNPEVAFLILVTTDGQDNASHITGASLALRIKRLKQNGNWTVVFRGPRGIKAQLAAYGFDSENVLEFDASSTVEYEKSTTTTREAATQYYAARSAGTRSTTTFYADTSKLKASDVKSELANISKKVKVTRVPAAWEKKQIKDFVEQYVGLSYVLGTAYYQLSKREEIQDSKRIIVWDKETGYYYTGPEARKMLGFPDYGTIKVTPGNLPRYEVFVQSMSVNRHLVAGTKVVIYHG